MAFEDHFRQTAEHIWILGGGKFGLHAMESLRARIPAARILLVDTQPTGHLPEKVKGVCADGIEWFADNFTPAAGVDRIVPALPLHLAAEWLKKRLAQEGYEVRSQALPDGLLHMLPHPLRCSPSQAVISHADFLCPADCLEPESFCTHTGLPRPPALYRLIDRVNCESFTPLSLRSRQFAAGVGGFYHTDLWNLLEKVKSLPDTPLLIGTACKCHGIVDALFFTGQARSG